MSDLPPTNESLPGSRHAGSPENGSPENGSPENGVTEDGIPRDGRRKIRIVTGSRLHFGLIDTVEPFGGVGVMIDQPTTEVIVSPADQFSCCADHTDRIESIVRRIFVTTDRGEQLPPCRIDVGRHARPHHGLGSGTQFSMAVAEAVCRWLGIKADMHPLATQYAARGKRSAVGIHGYRVGGLIFESSSTRAALNEIQLRSTLPIDWCVAVLCPEMSGPPIHGSEEVNRFARLSAAEIGQRDELRRIASEDLLPAADAADFAEFSDAVNHYNRRSGMLFQSIQGGPYNGDKVQSIINWLMDRGVVGVGQSSWGPGVFAWFESMEKAEPVVERLPRGVELITLARAMNVGRTLQESN